MFEIRFGLKIQIETDVRVSGCQKKTLNFLDWSRKLEEKNEINVISEMMNVFLQRNFRIYESGVEFKIDSVQLVRG